MKFMGGNGMVRNEFPTIKLYKNIGGSVHYWQIYGSSIDRTFLVIGEGILGETGDYIEISGRDLYELRETYTSTIEMKKSEGFDEPSSLHPMILQFQIGKWGPDDLSLGNEIRDYLDGFLFWTGNGKISGGNIGSGTVNFFFEAVEPAIAVNTIVYALKEKKIRQPFLIAQENVEEEDVEESISVKVLHPKYFKGSFII